MSVIKQLSAEDIDVIIQRLVSTTGANFMFQLGVISTFWEMIADPKVKDRLLAAFIAVQTSRAQSELANVSEFTKAMKQTLGLSDADVTRAKGIADNWMSQGQNQTQQ